MRRRRRLLVLVGCLVAAAAVGYGFRESIRLMLIVVAGRSPHCPLIQAARSAHHTKNLMAAKDRILAASKRLEEDAAGYVHWQTPRGRFWVVRGNDFFLPFHLAEQELNLYSRPEVAIRKGDVVLDCGANVGVYTRRALEEGARLVIAIEPAPENLECLRRNLAEEIAGGKAVVYPKGVWDKDDELTLYVDPGNTAAASFLNKDEKSRAVQRVPLTTIDQLVKELGLDRVDFIKMDIEGAEPKALQGGRDTLVRFHPRMAISTYHAPDHPETIPAVVRAIWPEHEVRCGVCTEANGGLRPDVMFFR